ncbi:MAG TPA: aldose 1-epimerase [Parafilimonas sp.]|nr:aldose 1-epimerase [Parafilimonas sp.]
MSFSVLIKTDDVFPVVILKDELQKTEAHVYTFGALLNGFVIEDRQNIIDGFASCKDAKQNITNAFKSAKLSPFVCRIKNGEYYFQDKKYKTGKFFLGEEAIHGLIYDAAFTIVDSNADDVSASIKLEYFYSREDEGFPFKFLCEVIYKLEKENKLSIITTITNKSEKQMPLYDGWHPYFKFDQPIDDLSFKINSNKILEFNDRLVPTGKVFPFEKFQSLQKLNDVFFDNCFQLKNTNNVACTIQDEKNNLRLNIFPSEAYPYLQVYTPPHRNSIAIENLSAAPDAFNNKMGLVILSAEESKTFSTIFQAVYFK